MALSKASMVLFVAILLVMSSHQVLSAEKTEFPETNKLVTGRKLAQSTNFPPTYGTSPGGGCYPPYCN
ncbi:conserved hypothetical protein [Ricinus communis]|uniref:Transmembrane protein n=1 Tax=Ricinus communis TaxID=3988 RepID=B9SJH3_RICCO|nr:conserved hypothetical protein [Ricinus communis]